MEKMKILFNREPKNAEMGAYIFSPQTLKEALESTLSGIKDIVSQENFEGKEEQALFLISGFEKFKRTLLIGIGDTNISNEKVRRGAAIAVKFAQAKKIQKISIFVPHLKEVSKKDAATALVEGSILANYSFQKYKTVKEDKRVFVAETEIIGELSQKEIEECRQAQVVCENANICRDLVNDNSSVANPDFFEKFVKTKLKGTSLKVTVLHEKEMQKLGMGLHLAVGRGSESRSRVIIIEYNGDKESKGKYLFVGKGITFDSGGLDIKPGESMENMRDDKAGASAVFALLKTCEDLKIKKNVIGIMGLAENLVDAKSYRQGDVYVSMKGLTVENNSTDAEGRLVLSDCIYYGVTKFKPKLVVDFSTLTGSAIRTFGEHVALMCATNDREANEFFESGQKTFERAWKMPMFEEYVKETKSLRADLRSLNKKPNNGAIFAACFLNNFTENTPFVHLDIAGTAFVEEPKPYYETGATGFGVRLATEYLKRQK